MLDLGYGDQFERWEAERADEHSEKAQAILHASAIRFCPACATEVLTRRNGTCVWDDGPTLSLPPVVGEHADTPTDLPAPAFSLADASAPDPSNGAGASEKQPKGSGVNARNEGPGGCVPWEEHERLRTELGIARQSLEYLLEHHADGDECLCDAARSVAAAGLSLTEQAA